ncbi:MAG: ketosteroid isomerase-like protein [Gammaproteobacteria bacterium]|jgi:ketosteroid isomerase-like protein
MSSIESRIAALEAKDEIKELTARYCHAVVDGDVDTILSLFCHDGAFRMRKKGVKGHDELREFYGAGVGAQTHKPFIQNNVVELEGEDRATGRCSVEIRIVQDGEAYTCAGHYFDTFRKEQGKWRFEDRQFNAYHYVPLAKGWTK